MSCDPNYNFSIDGHTMTIIEVDGVNTHPLTVDSISIFARQRYSFILTADQPTANYWIRAKPNVPIGKTQDLFDGGINSTILRYTDAPRQDPNTTQTRSTSPLRETDLHPLTYPAAPGAPALGAADVSLMLAIGLNAQTHQFMINGARFLPPSVPVLLQIMSGAKTPQELYPSGSVYTLPRNKVVEVSISGGSTGAPVRGRLLDL
ncbi:hypothetical protein C0992_004374 [Termitomyces sp. T32_za158]|nr:hypothetical protein C0992_004374 [Termitomyces sp. T32_za158]